MRVPTAALSAAAILVTVASAQTKSDGPTDQKAQKTYQQALEELHDRNPQFALEDFKKADKQDGGHCAACQAQMLKYGVELGDWKAAESAVNEMIANAQGPKETAIAHYQAATLYFREGLERRKDEFFARCHEEAGQALAAYSNFPEALALDGRALARLKQDDAAKAQFQQYLKVRTTDDAERQRVARYLEHPDLARAMMAPAFSVTTTEGQKISMDDLQGKVVLLDFWATWCGPCREALPHIRNVAKKFQGQPLVILSVSLDTDEGKWKEFIAKNEMTWPQYRDGAFGGPVAKLFGVNAIPHTFTIDSYGVLAEEHVGDASIEGKLKKLLSQVRANSASTLK
jgi:thiol-disulfide isomerase/thioredoxin